MQTNWKLLFPYGALWNIISTDKIQTKTEFPHHNPWVVYIWRSLFKEMLTLETYLFCTVSELYYHCLEITVRTGILNFHIYCISMTTKRNLLSLEGRENLFPNYQLCKLSMSSGWQAVFFPGQPPSRGKKILCKYNNVLVTHLSFSMSFLSLTEQNKNPALQFYATRISHYVAN